MSRVLALMLICYVFVSRAQTGGVCYADSFNTLNSQVRDGLIAHDKAKALAANYLKEIERCYKQQIRTKSQTQWIFPLEKYGKKAIGGKEGSGYKPQGYNYFDGNKHKGHPAHDIFIHDPDQDGVDNTFHQEIKVLSVSAGIVVAMENEWDTTSALRGGKYIWVFDVKNKMLHYYAHKGSILVQLGDFLVRGQVIGTVGRTGLNAFKPRSPTHLHFMSLKVDEAYYPRPVNTYVNLINAIRKP